jgi:hypothetical protein
MGVPDSIQSNLGNVMTDAELAEQRRLVQFFNYPWPMGPVIIEVPTGPPLQLPSPSPSPGESAAPALP